MEDQAHNDGFQNRKQLTLDSKDVTMFGRPHLDLCFQNRLILNGVDIKMRFVCSKNIFCLMGQGLVKIKDIGLFVRKVKLNPSVQLGHINALERTPAKYPIRRVETKVFSIPKGNQTINQENMFLGQLP